MSAKKKKAPWVVLIAIVLAMFVGDWAGTQKGVFNVTYYSLFDLLGTLFLHALMLVVVPLVSASIISGVSRIGKEGAFGRLGFKTFAFYVSTTFVAVLTGLLFVNLLKPGLSGAGGVSAVDHAAVAEKLSGSAISVRDVVLQIVPSNIVDAFAKGEMLGLIFFSLLFGYAITKIEHEVATILDKFWQAIFQAMIQITHLIMKVLPLGVFCLVAKAFATTGFSSLRGLLWFLVTVLLSLLAFSLIALPLFLRIIGNVSPWRHLRAMGPALITAFSTSSSSATLPVTIDCVEKRAGVSNKICSLVIPLGTSLNMSGSALYECVAAMFVAQVYGVQIDLVTQFIVVFLALLTSMGVAGIPAASLVAVIVILKAIGLPVEGIGLFIAVDRVLDMCRTTVNVLSDSCCAVLVARSEGEVHVLSKETFPEL